jgi:hypothetical protein
VEEWNRDAADHEDNEAEDGPTPEEQAKADDDEAAAYALDLPDDEWSVYDHERWTISCEPPAYENDVPF